MIMKSFRFLLAAMLVGCSTLTFAQGSNVASSDMPAWSGLRFSYDRTFVSQDWEDAEGMDMNGFSIDYEHAFRVSKKLPLFIQTGAGINFARHKDSEDGEGYSYESKLSMLGLTIPVNVVYGIQLNDKLALKPYTGLYLRVNLLGKVKETDEFSYDGETEKEEYDYSLFDKDEMGEDGKWKRCQIGWQIGATLDINKFNVGIGYALDFNEIAEKTKTSKFAVRVGYNF